MDGHYRLHALRKLGIPEVECLISLEDESFTYNARISRLPPIQEHSMIAKAVNSGVPVERLAAALHKNVSDIKEWLNMLKGISSEAVELLKDKQICPGALKIMRKVLGMRQVEIAELMISANNYTKSYAEALLLGTPKDMLVEPEAAQTHKRISREELARMEFEMGNLERDSKASEKDYGNKMLNLTVLRAYVRKLLENARITRFLGNRRPEMLAECQRIAATDGV